MEPKLVILYRLDWEERVEAETAAKYEKLDNLLDRLGLDGCIDIRAGMYYDGNTDTVFSEESIILDAFDGESYAVGLTNHELGHKMKVPKSKHPTGFKILVHAVSVGFDDRAGSRIFRWRRYKPGLTFTQSWLKAKADEYRNGRLHVSRLSDLKK